MYTIDLRLLVVASVLLPFLQTFASPSNTKLPVRDTCSVWTTVANDLKSSFVNSDGTCNDNARAAIRLSFHDCFPGSCDGSIILANECQDRSENVQLIPICSFIHSKATQYGTTVADMIQFGTAIGLISCPGGPPIKFYTGRTDSSTANPTGQMPSSTADATTLISDFAAKGFSSVDLVALVGAHSTGKTLQGQGLDTTPGDWDTTFYSETADGTAPASIESDENLSHALLTSATWNTFAASEALWNAAFVPAMERMSLLGNNLLTLTDCTSVVLNAI